MANYKFNKKSVTEDCITWIKNWIDSNGNNSSKVIIGISGGKDSTVAAALCTKALGPDRVIGVLMPNKTQNDIDDSRKVCEFLNIESYEVNIADIYSSIKNILETTLNTSINSNFETNTPARIRMTVLYSIVAIFGNCFVCNTGNLSESFIGWETYGGDNLGDFAPLSNLTKTEVQEVGKYLKLPDDLILKQPADGMCGSTDEDILGFTYKELDDCIRKNRKGINFSKILCMNTKSAFKRINIRIPAFEPKLY